MASWLVTEAPSRFEELAVPEAVKQTLLSTSTSIDPPHLMITGPAGVGKTACWRLFARQILGPGWKSTTHILQARDLVRQRGAMATFEEFLRPSGSEKDTLAGRVFSLFLLTTANLSASVVNPTIQVILGFFFNNSGTDFSFTRGIFEVLNPLFAR